MHYVFKVLAAAALLVFGLAVTDAEAAPAGSGLVPLKSASQTSALVEKTYWVRRCYKSRYGVRCKREWVQPYRTHRYYKKRPHRHYKKRHHTYRRW